MTSEFAHRNGETLISDAVEPGVAETMTSHIGGRVLIRETHVKADGRTLILYRYGADVRTHLDDIVRDHG
jgi:hypothetical protein